MVKSACFDCLCHYQIFHSWLDDGYPVVIVDFQYTDQFA